jgi:hypothetical protein
MGKIPAESASVESPAPNLSLAGAAGNEKLGQCLREHHARNAVHGEMNAGHVAVDGDAFCMTHQLNEDRVLFDLGIVGSACMVVCRVREMLEPKQDEGHDECFRRMSARQGAVSRRLNHRLDLW